MGMTVGGGVMKKGEQDGGSFEVGCCPRNLLYMFSSGTVAARHAHVLSLEHWTALNAASILPSFFLIINNPSLIGDSR
jgi:hypothetical protein